MPKKLDKTSRIYLEVEKSRIQREKAAIVLNKSIVMFLSFFIAGIIGFAFDYINSLLLNALVVAGIIVLLMGSIPYMIITSKEERKINKLLK